MFKKMTFCIVASTWHNAKCHLFEFFKLDTLDSEPDEYISIVDTGLIRRKTSPTSEDRETKRWMATTTIGNIIWIKYVISILHSWQSHTFLWTTYNIHYTIKDDEHHHRAAKFFITGIISFPLLILNSQENVNSFRFLVNHSNRIRLQKLVKDKTCNTVMKSMKKL